MYQRILVPLDGSDTARRGLVEALSLAADRQSTLCLLHVTNDFPLMMESSSAVDFDQYRRELREHGQKLLDEARQPCAAIGVPVETHLHELRGGRVADAIVQQATELGCQLIVIGTHGRRGIQRALLGSDAESVARASTLPVLLVRGALAPDRT